MKSISLQDILDAAWQAFIVERQPPGYDKEASMCMYLTDDGRKCAVGLVLPDGHPAQQQLDSLGELVGTYPELFDRQLWHMGTYRLDSFQRLLHDDMIDHDTGTWKDQDLRKRYVYAAEEYGLTLPE